MKHFIINSISVISVLLIILLSFEAYAIYFSKEYTIKINGWEIYHSITKSKTKRKVKKLVLGDSVCMQMYPCDRCNTDTLYSLASNQATTMVGQYILLNNFLKANKSNPPDTVVLLLHPLSLTNNLDKFAFHYFLKPFYHKEYKDAIDSIVLSRINSILFPFIIYPISHL